LIVTVGGALALWRIPDLSLYLKLKDFDFKIYELVLAVLIVGSALVAVRSPSRMGAVAALGAAGYSIALIYLLFGAPDLAMTQFAIESLTVILFVLAFYHLPKFQTFSSDSARYRDAAIAAAAGMLMTALVLVAVNAQFSDAISNFFVDNAWDKAYGKNIVNVILVDFRGLDTMGEITVLGIAGIGVYALLKLRKGEGSDK
jgi:multicomponent Na+:H+ antiporter subunit A